MIIIDILLTREKKSCWNLTNLIFMLYNILEILFCSPLRRMFTIVFCVYERAIL